MTPFRNNLLRLVGSPLARRAASVLLLVTVVAGCGAPERGPKLTVERYLSAIQQRDEATLAHLWAPYRRDIAGKEEEERKAAYARFRSLILRARRDYESAKREGMLTPDPFGISLFRVLRLGQGGVTVPLGSEVSEDGQSATVRTRLNTNLDNLKLNNLPDGVQVYLPGHPLGRLVKLSVGYEEPSDHKLLGSVAIDWKLSRAPEDWSTPAGWLIESIAGDPESAVVWQHSRQKPGD